MRQQQQPVRVVKREQRSARDECTPQAASANGVQSAERALRKVVSGWIHEHRQSSERLQLLSLPALLW
jgi:hypothetical protein